jgi:hypothetical protein
MVNLGVSLPNGYEKTRMICTNASRLAFGPEEVPGEPLNPTQYSRNKHCHNSSRKQACTERLVRKVAQI